MEVINHPLFLYIFHVLYYVLIVNLTLIDYIHSTNIKLILYTRSCPDLWEGSLYIYVVGGSVNWYNHYGEQYGGSLKN